MLKSHNTTQYYTSSTHYKLYIGFNLHAHLLGLLDVDGCSYIGLRPLQSSKLVIPTKGIMIFISWDKSFKSKEADYSVSQVLFLHLAKEFLLLPEYIVTRLTLPTRDASSWELPSWKSQEYDTTRCNPSIENLPLG